MVLLVSGMYAFRVVLKKTGKYTCLTICSQFERDTSKEAYLDSASLIGDRFMNARKISTIFLFIIFSSNVFAFYGGGTVGGMSSCESPELTEFKPPHLSVVTPQSEFSFRASKTVSPRSIVVSAKKKAVEMTVDKTDDGYIVSGKLPQSLNNTYARIEIGAATVAGCKGNNGWLLNIRETEKLGASGAEPAVPILSED